MNEPRFGPLLTATGCIFRLWAPAAQRVDLLLYQDKPPGAANGRETSADSLQVRQSVAMERQAGGWYVAHVDDVKPGALYRFQIDGSTSVPDPASAFQPSDVSGPSQIVDHAAYQWRTTSWRGRSWHEVVVLEAHVGTFTPEGTYRAMIGKLDHLVETGITALELMPLNDFAGRRNWGYDGVLWYAPDSAYGSPDDLKALIDAAHLRGLMVFLDVVYNHFGPEGNYLGRYAPSFFTSRETPWGEAIDYRVPEVRAFAIENALYWLRTFRFDGLRLDAVHAIVEAGSPELITDLSRAVGELAAASGRDIHLMLENDDNRSSLLDPESNPPKGKFRAQWNDDYHHAWHVFLTHEERDYYRDYTASPQASIQRALNSGFVYQGEPSAYREGKVRGEPSGGLSPTAFVNFLQNHDQIGNRALGDRLVTLAKPEAIEAALAITLLAPMPPMLFMGEEWGARQPFPFFCDFQGELAAAVRAGRRREFHDTYEALGDAVPDPLDESTFRSAVLEWSARDGSEGRHRLKFVRDLLAIRRRAIMPILAGSSFDPLPQWTLRLLIGRWRMGNSRRLHLIANLSENVVLLPAEFPHKGTDILWGASAAEALPPWAVVWALETA